MRTLKLAIVLMIGLSVTVFGQTEIKSGVAK